MATTSAAKLNEIASQIGFILGYADSGSEDEQERAKDKALDYLDTIDGLDGDTYLDLSSLIEDSDDVYDAMSSITKYIVDKS